MRLHSTTESSILRARAYLRSLRLTSGWPAPALARGRCCGRRGRQHASLGRAPPYLGSAWPDKTSAVPGPHRPSDRSALGLVELGNAV